jgi:chromosome segregation ATPase
MRRSALTAEQTAERALEEMQKAVERAQRFEAELAQVRLQIENALSRVRSAEELQRQAGESAQAAAAQAKRAEERVGQARTELQNRTRRFLEALEQAQKAVDEAAAQHGRSVSVAGDAERALELALGAQRAGDETAPGAGGALREFRTMRQRSARASERARESLGQAEATLRDLRRQLTQPE